VLSANWCFIAHVLSRSAYGFVLYTGENSILMLKNTVYSFRHRPIHHIFLFCTC